MNNSLEEFVDSLNLPFDGDMNDNEYIVNVDNSNDFSTLYNKIVLNNDLEQVDNSLATERETVFTFSDGYYECKLEANYDKDIYKLTVKER